MNWYSVRYTILRPFRVAVRALALLIGAVPGTTFGERAEMAPGPCTRCVGHALVQP